MAKTVAAMVLAFGFLVPNAMGQTDYPAKPVKLLVGFQPAVALMYLPGYWPNACPLSWGSLS